MESRHRRVAVVIVVETLAALGVVGAIVASAAQAPALGGLALSAALLANAILTVAARRARQRIRGSRRTRAERDDARDRP
ncbi:MAG: hypothetical protein J0H23_15495 [Micrococcales bacterium]|nr:hypothetical protein [Micrococcales bacterium]OJX68741.1 MAG: hypothetical protein BGO94_08935 [Micrococcales bacterium 72-143]